jgi:hypothetical protein
MNEDAFLTKIMMKGTDILDRIDDLKCEYVWDWEDEFDDIHEAYEEQGRGQAEYQAIEEYVRSTAKDEGIHLYEDVLLKTIERVAEALEVPLC